MEMSPPRIALVVATYKRPDALSTMIASLRRQTLPPAAFEVVVVVDGRDEHEGRYQDLFEAALADVPFPFSYEFQANAGQSVARHRGMARTRAPWICIADDDMDLSPGFLEAHLAALEAGGEKAVVIGNVIPEEGWEGSPLYESVRTRHMLEAHQEMARGERVPRGFAFVTQNVAFGRAFYEEVGGFDEQLRLGEDIELGLRFEFAGGHFVFAERASAVHRSRVGSYEAWLRRCIEYGKNGVYIYEKLGRDVRAHFLRNLVKGSRANAVAVHLVCWSDPLARATIAALHTFGEGLRRIGAIAPAIATHKAILSIAFHLGVKHALGSWTQVIDAERALAAHPEAPADPT
jgi:GT2 family glycosyltransferase